MKLRKATLASAIAISVTGLAACGGSSAPSQDVGSGGESVAQSRVIAARAVDGYLAGAIAFVDLNENGTLDAFEPRAITDTDGFFSYNHLTGADYCADGASRHCLKATIAADAEVLVRVTGGYDSITGLPFEGTLSVRSSDLDRSDLRLVTPQTSLIADLDTTAQGKLALIAAGVLSSDGSLLEDHIDGINGAHATRAQVATILARVLSVSSDAAVISSSVDDDERETTWHDGYAPMLEGLSRHYAAGDSGSFGEVFASLPVLKEAMRRTAFAKVHPGESMPAGFALTTEAAADPLLQFAANLVALSEELIAAMQAGSTTPEELKGALRALAIAGERGLNNPTDAELSDLFAWVRAQLAQGIGSDLKALGGERIDLNALISADYDFDSTSNTISSSAVIPLEAAHAFASIANTAFHVTVDKEGERGAGLIFMVGDAVARSGDLKLCVRYSDESGDFNTGSSSDPNGAMLVHGRWNLLNDYTLTMNADVAGGVRALLVKSVGVSGNQLKYRFDFGSDPSEWTGPAPTGYATGAVPANDLECKNALVQQFGPVG